MRFVLPTLGLAAVLAVPGVCLAQSTMSHDAMMAPAPATTMATLMCRKATDKDTHSGMMSMHETLATTSDGDKLVCMSTGQMHAAMSATTTKAKQAADADAASQVWQDFLRTAIQIPY
ncbi:MAG: hypothetical protein ABSD03_05810 [Vulcanimicrobiaceae bacterium]|jgi:hypothetical protein